jgi:hypothetical protein
MDFPIYYVKCSKNQTTLQPICNNYAVLQNTHKKAGAADTNCSSQHRHIQNLVHWGLSSQQRQAQSLFHNSNRFKA